jgi:nicotinamide mononucleotide transporter
VTGKDHLRTVEVATMLGLSAVMIAASWFGWWVLPMTEVLGFTTGGVCVWLVVREHLWNWPVGLANNAFFFILFLQSRLFADMGLQVIYLGFGIYGWVHWRSGGAQHSELPISRTSPREWAVLSVSVPFATWGLREVLVWVNGAAPFWDSLTTVLSLAAQYLLCQKRLENWWFWIVADLIYIPLYFSRKLPLTGVLYAVLLTMCLVGLRQWTRSAPKAVTA